MTFLGEQNQSVMGIAISAIVVQRRGNEIFSSWSINNLEQVARGFTDGRKSSGTSDFDELTREAAHDVLIRDWNEFAGTL